MFSEAKIEIRSLNCLYKDLHVCLEIIKIFKQFIGILRASYKNWSVQCFERLKYSDDLLNDWVDFNV